MTRLERETPEHSRPVLERIPDPSDGRAKLIRWTDQGREALVQGLGVLGALERELAEVVGADELSRVHRTLLAIIEELERGE